MRENIKVQHLNCRGSTENGKKLETLSKKENLQVIRPKKPFKLTQSFSNAHSVKG